MIEQVFFRFSIIIPAYNEEKIINECLKHLNQQSFSNPFEVITVDDGSTDKTVKIIKEWQKKNNKIFQLNLIQEKHQKQAHARNKGIEKAQGEIIIFIGADILVNKFFLEEHDKFHKKFSQNNYIGLGYMTWSPELKQDRFRKWLESSGLMLSYRGLKNYELTNFWHFYTGNISLKKNFLIQYKFDEDFFAYGWEDIKLGYEMLQDGGQLYYISKAKAFHRHALTEQDLFPKRMKEIGQSAVIFQKKCPKVKVLPTGIKLLIFKIISNLLMIKLLKILKKEWYWYALSKKYFLEGINKTLF